MSTFALLINKSESKDMEKIEIGKTLTQSLREMSVGETREVLFFDCKETTLRGIASRMRREGLVYSVSAMDDRCAITRTA